MFDVNDDFVKQYPYIAMYCEIHGTEWLQGVDDACKALLLDTVNTDSKPKAGFDKVERLH